MKINISSDEVRIKVSRKEEPPKWSGFTPWAVLLLAVAVLCGSFAYYTWRQGFSSNDKPPQANGGLLLFVAAPLENNVRASVDARVSPTGYPNTSLFDLTISFERAHPGLRWFIAASGQYRPSVTTPLGAFCPGGTRAYRSNATTIACNDNPFDGSRNVEYNRAGHIGVLDGRNINRITDSFDGYIDADTTVISGTLMGMDLHLRENDLSTRITIPIATPSPSRIASDEFFACAPIAIVDQGDFGVGSPLGAVAVTRPQAHFAESSTETPVSYLDVSSLNLAIDLDTSGSQLNWASPPTVQADQLRWQVTGQGIQAIRFSLHNPVAADHLSRNSLFAGIYLSIAASALLLLLEKLIEFVLRRRRPEIS
jgi:hypothetical protein